MTAGDGRPTAVPGFLVRWTLEEALTTLAGMVARLHVEGWHEDVIGDQDYQLFVEVGGFTGPTDAVGIYVDDQLTLLLNEDRHPLTALRALLDMFDASLCMKHRFLRAILSDEPVVEL